MKPKIVKANPGELRELGVELIDGYEYIWADKDIAGDLTILGYEVVYQEIKE